MKDSARHLRATSWCRELQAAFAWIPESKLIELKPLMLRFDPLPQRLTHAAQVAGIAFFCLLFALAILPQAHGQADFTLTASAFNHFAIDPSQTAFSTLTLSPVNGFNGTVNLACTVTPSSTTSPGCEVSPTQVTPAATASLIVNGINPTSGQAAAPGTYKITVAATGYNGTQHSLAPTISVVAVAPAFTITVGAGVAPGSVTAGSGGQATINVNPLNGYVSPNGQGQGVWLSCASVSPLVTIPPVCTFNPQPVQVNGTATQVTLTISTTGPITAEIGHRPRAFYGLLLPLPLLALLGAAADKRLRKAWGLVAVLLLSGLLVLTPACATSSTQTTPTTSTASGITPKNTYTFTITGIDSNGTVSTNTGANSSAPYVTLNVN